MTIENAIKRCDNINSNSFETSVKIDFLSKLDAYIQSEVIDNFELNEGETEKEFTGYDEDTSLKTELLVCSPYDDIYENFLIAQVYLMLGENSKYNNYISIYNTILDEYKKYYTRTHKHKKNTQIVFW